MSNSYSYTTELEQLIINTLLPAYEKYCKDNSIKEPYSSIEAGLIKQIKRKKLVAALLRPAEN